MTTPALPTIGDDEPKKLVYFILNESSRLVKVGFTSSIGKRFTDLQTASGAPLLLILYFRGDRATERRIHAFLNAARTFGEWFRYEEIAQDLVDEIGDFLCREDDDKEPWDHFVSAKDIDEIVSDPGFGTYEGQPE